MQAAVMNHRITSVNHTVSNLPLSALHLPQVAVKQLASTPNHLSQASASGSSRQSEAQDDEFLDELKATITASQLCTHVVNACIHSCAALSYRLQQICMLTQHKRTRASTHTGRLPRMELHEGQWEPVFGHAQVSMLTTKPHP